MLDGKERCYNEDEFTREMCPEYVDSVFLSLAAGQWSCQPVRHAARAFACPSPYLC